MAGYPDVARLDPRRAGQVISISRRARGPGNLAHRRRSGVLWPVSGLFSVHLLGTMTAFVNTQGGQDE